jgi:hypothetical protein
VQPGVVSARLNWAKLAPGNRERGARRDNQMNFTATPFALRFDRQTDEIVCVDWFSHAQIAGNDLAAVFQHQAQFLPAEQDLNTVLLDDDTPKKSTEEVPKVVRGKRGQARGEFLGGGDQVSTNGWTLIFCAEPVEYLCIGFQENEKPFNDPAFDFVCRHSGRTIALARRVFDRKLRDVVTITPASLDCERRCEAIPRGILD